MSHNSDHSDESEPIGRRRFLGNTSRAAMTVGIVGGYGGLAAIAGRFLYPAESGEGMWQFVAAVDRLDVGESLRYEGPSGETINVARQARNGGDDDFIALSSTCPHLGCQVRWEAQNDRFFCPCHNGVFDPTGRAIAGPPGDAGQSLPQYPLRVEGGLLFILVPPPALADAKGRVVDEPDGPSGPGHDPCLGCRPGPSNQDTIA